MPCKRTQRPVGPAGPVRSRAGTAAQASDSSYGHERESQSMAFNY